MMLASCPVARPVASSSLPRTTKGYAAIRSTGARTALRYPQCSFLSETFHPDAAGPAPEVTCPKNGAKQQRVNQNDLSSQWSLNLARIIPTVNGRTEHQAPGFQLVSIPPSSELNHEACL
jgi:hypothetical protein